MMNISFINFTSPTNNVTYDYFWLSAKTYVEDNYQGNVKWNWCYPITSSDYESIDEIVDLVVSQKPVVISLSMYVWNYGLSLKVASLVKKILPKVIVVAGGPHLEYNQPDYFLKHRQLDFICESDGYGEPFFNEFLYQLETDRDWDKVPYLRKMGFKSTAKFTKRDFQWPRNIYSRNHDYLISLKQYAIDNGINFYLQYESSRGCPYGCTYCEWGGGINSKVTFKPYEYIQEDFDYIFTHIKPEVFAFTDANFGIVERDIDIAQMIVDYKVSVGVPYKIYLYGPTKSSKKNLYAIEEMFAKHDLIQDHKVPVQDFNPDVAKNISRTDAPWEAQYEAYDNIRKKYNTRIRLELMLGLPGATLDSYYQAFDVMGPQMVFGRRYVWQLLPTSPAAAISYREKFKLKTIKIRHVSYSMGESEFIREDEEQPSHKSLLLDPEYTDPTEVVVGSYSYTTDEWLEMYVIDSLTSTFEVEGYLRFITRYMADVRGIKHSVFYRDLWKSFINVPSNTIYSMFMTSIIDQLKHKIAEKSTDSIDLFNVPRGFPWRLKAKVERLSALAININRLEFYQSIHKWLIDTYGPDDAIEDLTTWNFNMVKFLDYEKGSSFESEYDWYHWTETGELNKVRTINKPLDEIYSSDNKPIDWWEYNMQDRLKKFFLPLCSNLNHYMMFNELETQHVSN